MINFYQILFWQGEYLWSFRIGKGILVSIANNGFNQLALFIRWNIVILKMLLNYDRKENPEESGI